MKIYRTIILFEIERKQFTEKLFSDQISLISNYCDNQYNDNLYNQNA